MNHTNADDAQHSRQRHLSAKIITIDKSIT